MGLGSVHVRYLLYFREISAEHTYVYYLGIDSTSFFTQTKTHIISDNLNSTLCLHLLHYENNPPNLEINITQRLRR